MCWRSELRRAALPALLIGTACAAEPPSPPAPAAEPSTDTATAVGAARPPAAPAASASAFPHGAHDVVECRRCHEQLRGHGTHAGVACRDCHDAPAAGPVLARQQDCSTCHHDSTQQRNCTQCHDTRATGAEGRLLVAARFSASGTSRTRELPFRHSMHETLACNRCHDAARAAPAGNACTTCHERHHDRASNCAGCHPPPAPAVHSSESHLGCSGGGCHEDAAIAALPLSRAVCVACHRDQASHEPASECDVCHLVRAPPARMTAGTP